jgi:acetyltransferase-like isoleucine patch superfamily enzyme
VLIFSLKYLQKLKNRFIAKSNNAFIHPSAICESFDIGRGSRIWAFSHVLPKAQIGSDCNICDHVFIENHVVIGDRVTIKSGVQVWDQIQIGDDVFIGPNVSFTNDKYPRSKAEFDRTTLTKIGNGVTIGAGAMILPGLTIGNNSFIGAGAVVTKNVLNGRLILGNPGIDVGKAPPPILSENGEFIE